MNKKESRVINVSALAYVISSWNAEAFKKFQNNLEFKGEENNYGAISAYTNSKLGNIYFTQYLADVFDSKYPYIKSSCLHPGGINTELSNNGPWYLRLFIFLCHPIIQYVSKSPRAGAQTTLYLCYEDFSKVQNGQYYDSVKRVEYYENAKNLENREEFIKWSYMLLEKGINGRFELHKP